MASRPLLTAAKAMSGKLDLRIQATSRGIEVLTDKGGSLEVPHFGELRDAGFAKKARQPVARAVIEGRQWGQLAKLFDAVQQDIENPTPTLDFTTETGYLTAVMPTEKKALYATLEVPTEGAAVYGAAYTDFWRSLKVLKEDGTLNFCKDGVVAVAGNIEVFCTPYLVSRYDAKKKIANPPQHPEPWPVLGFKGNPTTSVKVDRKKLIEIIKGQAPLDEQNRVTLNINDAALLVTAYGAESGFEIPVATSGTGIRSMNADYLMAILRAIDSKEVTLSWGNSPAVKVDAEGFTGWTILVAPTMLDR